MGFDRDKLPDPVSYFEGIGLALKGPGRWKTTRCNFHGGSDSMRVNTATGGWICMACLAKGGDIVSFEMQLAGVEFVQAAKALGAWTDDGQPPHPSRNRPATLSPRTALEVLSFEAMVIALVGADLAKGKAPSAVDLKRLHVAVGRIQALAGEYAPC